MNSSMIRYILGQVIRIEGILMLPSCIVAVFYRESEGFIYLLVGALLIAFGFLLTMKKPANYIFYLKEGCVMTGLSWIVMSLCGCLPFIITGEIPSFIDALFETVSGFTTTGASILSDVEALSHASLFWRSFTHWIGGMGVLVFLLAIIPMSGGSHINLMRAESPGPSVGKLVPKIKDSARILYLIYIGLTVVEFIFLLVGRMPVFDALTTSLGTAGTGGFGIKNDSIAGYSAYLQWVITIFMILFGVNFNLYYLILFGKFKAAFAMEEVRWYFIIILVAVAAITVNIYRIYGSLGESVTKAAFQVGAIITTTGFSTADFGQWPMFSQSILVLLMFIGACAGSTGGGIKVSRFLLMFKTVRKECSSYIHPKIVKKIDMDGKPVEHDVIRSVNVYLITFIVIFVGSILLISIEGKDLTTNFTAVAATINNIGPGLSLVGPSCNFGHFTVFSKLVLIFDMLAGRLELFPIIMLLHPGVWSGMRGRRTV